MSWTAIATHHGVSVRTLFRWRDETEFQEPLEIGTRELVFTRTLSPVLTQLTVSTITGADDISVPK